MNEIMRYGAYVCLSQITDSARNELPDAGVEELADSIGFRNEFESTGGDPENAIAFLQRVNSTPAHIGDDGLLNAQFIIHIASQTGEQIARFTEEAIRLFNRAARVRIYAGVVRPKNYTGEAMFNFAYAKQVEQQHGSKMPNAFLVPMSKTTDWWKKDWMERHTYFLPRYNENGVMVNQGHALAAAAGIPVLMRRTYKHMKTPAPTGEYDFVNYFECADEHIKTFYDVCAALRDITKNPEWKFVREGPTWHGKRVARWPDLFGKRE